MGPRDGGHPVTARTLTEPWDEPWVHVHRLTRAMFVVLYSAHEHPGLWLIDRAVYPAGQMRLIRAGLRRRGLVEPDGRLTMCGQVAAVWAARGVARAYPGAVPR